MLLQWALALFFIVTFTSCSHKNHEHHHGDHQHPEGHSMHHDFKDAEMWSKKFDAKDRLDWQKPDEVVKLMNIKTGDTVAEIGAGTGYMLPYLSKATGNKGQVFALDVEETLITFMKERTKKENLSNVKAELIPFDSPNLKNKKPNQVLFVNTWHHISDRTKYSKQLFEQTPKQTTLYLVEPEPGKGGPGPKDAHRMSAKATIEEISTAGFNCETAKESLPYQYVIVCKK